MRRLKANFDRAVQVAADYLAGALEGAATAQQVLAAYADTGGLCYCGGDALAFLAQQVENEDDLVDDLLLATGIVLEDDGAPLPWRRWSSSRSRTAPPSRPTPARNYWSTAPGRQPSTRSTATTTTSGAWSSRACSTTAARPGAGRSSTCCPPTTRRS